MNGLPIGIVPLDGYFTLPLDFEKFDKRNCWKLDHNIPCQRKYYFQADTREELANWRSTLIRAGVQHYAFDPLLLEPKEGTSLELITYKASYESERKKYEAYNVTRSMLAGKQINEQTKTLNQLLQEFGGVESLFAFICNGRIGIPLSHRRRSAENKDIIECFFKGQTAIEWMGNSFGLNKDDAISLGNQLMNEGYIFHSLSKRGFENNNHFYFYPQSDKYITPSLELNPRGPEFESQLKQLINSAISLAADRQGYLLKKGKQQDKWKEHLAMVYRNKLCYFSKESQKDTKPKRIINLTGKEARISISASTNGKEEVTTEECTLILETMDTHEKVATFLAMTPLDAIQWANVINNSLTFYID